MKFSQELFGFKEIAVVGSMADYQLFAEEELELGLEIAEVPSALSAASVVVSPSSSFGLVAVAGNQFGFKEVAVVSREHFTAFIAFSTAGSFASSDFVDITTTEQAFPSFVVEGAFASEQLDAGSLLFARISIPLKPRIQAFVKPTSLVRKPAFIKEHPYLSFSFSVLHQQV